MSTNVDPKGAWFQTVDSVLQEDSPEGMGQAVGDSLFWFVTGGGAGKLASRLSKLEAGISKARDLSKSKRVGSLAERMGTHRGKTAPRHLEHLRQDAPISGACFVAGTQVETDKGKVSIEDIKPGDRVLSRSEDGSVGYKPVLQVFVTHPIALMHLSYRRESSGNSGTSSSGDGDADDGDPDGLHTIVGTKVHRFWSVTRSEWIEMVDLEVGERLLLADGSFAVIIRNELEQADEGNTFTTYNFEVPDWSSYYVAADGSGSKDSAVWVHNLTKNPCAQQSAPGELSNKVLGELGEAEAIRLLEQRGYSEIFSIQNSSGWGIDLIATNKSGEIRFFEIKANTSRLSKPQKKGARAYVVQKLEEAVRGYRNWKNAPIELRLKAQELLDKINSGEIDPKGIVLRFDSQTGTFKAKRWR
jgi:Holliday junction resolvase-like predicted endonuclease